MRALIRLGGNGMTGVKLCQIETYDDLVRLGIDYLLDSRYPFSELQHCYYPCSDNYYNFDPVDAREVVYLLIVDNRLYREKVTAYVDEDGDIYLDEDTLEEIT